MNFKTSPVGAQTLRDKKNFYKCKKIYLWKGNKRNPSSHFFVFLRMMSPV